MKAVLLKTSDSAYYEECELTTLDEFINLVEEITKDQKNGFGDVLVWIGDGVMYVESHDGYAE